MGIFKLDGEYDLNWRSKHYRKTVTLKEALLNDSKILVMRIILDNYKISIKEVQNLYHKRHRAWIKSLALTRYEFITQ